MTKAEQIKKVLSDPNLLIEINTKNMETFRAEVMPDIYDKQENFPRDKDFTRPWEKFRKYTMPPSRNMLGVFSGATYTAFIQDGVPNREIFENITPTSAVIGLKDAEYINLGLYLSEENKAKLQENAKQIILEKLK